MKRIFIIVTILFISFMSYIIFSQDDPPKPVVAVLMLENREKDSRLDVLCCTIKDTIALTLKLMGKYRVIEDDNVINYEKTDKIRQYAVDNKVDNVMFGRTLKNQAGQIIIKMSAYDKFQDKVTITEQQAVDNIFEVFNAADELVVALLEGFSGIRVAYGSIKLANTGTEGDYTVFIDDQEIGDTLTAIDKVFVGKHRLRVTQKRMFRELVLLEEDMLIEEEKEVSFEFAIPYLTAEEESEFNKLDRFIMANWDKREKKQEVEDELVKVCGLLGEAQGVVSFNMLKDRYDKLNQQYKISTSSYNDIEVKIIHLNSKENIKNLLFQKETVFTSEGFNGLIENNTAGSITLYSKEIKNNKILFDLGPSGQEVEEDCIVLSNANELENIDESWVKNQNNDHYYKRITANSLYNAENYAKSFGGHVVTINNSYENKWVAKTFKDGNIGLYYASNNKYKWISGEGSNFRNWKPGEPNEDGTGQLASFEEKDGDKWNDRGIMDEWYYIIECSNTVILKQRTQLDNNFTILMKPSLNWVGSHSKKFDYLKNNKMLKDGVKINGNDINLTIKDLKAGKYSIVFYSLNVNSTELGYSSEFSIQLKNLGEVFPKEVLSKQHTVNVNQIDKCQTQHIYFISDGSNDIGITLKLISGELWLNGFVIEQVPFFIDN